MPFFWRKRKSKQKERSLSATSPATSSTQEATKLSNNGNSLERTTNNKQKPGSLFPSLNHSKATKSAINDKINDKYSDKQKFTFHCQLAHGSPTGIISGFNNVKELYQKIADCFEIPVSTILFCTLNTHKIDMNKLLGGQIGLDDFIFAHVKGQAKEIEFKKTDSALGLTITDNGAGYSFIKRIREGSIIDSLPNLVKIGDHIEKVNDQSVVGIRHFEVAKMLKDIPVSMTLKLRLIEPNAFGFHVEPAKRGRHGGDVTSGTKTLRFKADGVASIEEVDDIIVKAVKCINDLLENYIGISDSELAQKIWDLAKEKNNPSDFALAIDESEIGAFNFTDEFVFDLWAAIDDVKTKRVAEDKNVEDERL